MGVEPNSGCMEKGACGQVVAGIIQKAERMKDGRVRKRRGN